MRSARAVGHGHPLRHFFNDMVRRRFDGDVRLPDPRLAAYVSGLLVDFTRVDNLSSSLIEIYLTN